jgi:threonyl-tRNA synthetase
MTEQTEQDDRLYAMRHSAAHIMAEAVLELMPGAKFAIGPPIEHGFYYDFELPESLTNEDLAKIDRRMRRTMKRNYAFEQSEISKD